MKQDRFLIAILVAIVLLVMVALAIFLIRSDTLDYGLEETPEGVVRNYLIAIHKKDFERAYGYLQGSTEKPDYQEFRQAFLSSRFDTSNISVKIIGAEISGDEAVVEITVTHGGTDPFQGTWSDNESAWLVLEAGHWKLTKMPRPYWMWGWYR